MKLKKMFNKIFSLLIVIGIQLTNFLVDCKSSLLVNLCKDISTKSTELQLKTHLFCDYDTDLRPEKGDKNATVIKFTIMPKRIEFEDSTHILTIHAWLALNWTDPHLTWNPQDFNGLEALHITTDDIWVPDIVVYNAGDASDDQKIPQSYCVLNNDGSILCLPALKYKARCNSDYTNYPYDIQNCTIDIASWAYTTNEVVFDEIGEYLTINMMDFVANPEWRVLNLNSSSTYQNFKMNNRLSSHVLKIFFTLQRRDGMHIVYVVPAIVLMIMTLCVLWLDCHTTERMIVASISFICHLICIQDLYTSMPHNGAISPNLLRFYENSFLLMAFTLILTVLLRELHKLSIPAPQWITSTTFLVLRSKAGQILLLNILDPKASAFLEASADDNTDLVNMDKRGATTWNYVTLLLGWLAFISVFFTYIVMLALYMPVYRTI